MRADIRIRLMIEKSQISLICKYSEHRLILRDNEGISPCRLTAVSHDSSRCNSIEYSAKPANRRVFECPASIVAQETKKETGHPISEQWLEKPCPNGRRAYPYGTAKKIEVPTEPGNRAFRWSQQFPVWCHLSADFPRAQRCARNRKINR